MQEGEIRGFFTALIPSELEELLHKEGYPIERLEDGTWCSAFEANHGVQRFFVRLTDTWIFFTIAPYLGPPRSAVRRLKVYQRLLELNREMNLAKFALDPDGDVVLTVEFPTLHLDPAEAEAALSILTYYADRFRDELLS